MASNRNAPFLLLLLGVSVAVRLGADEHTQLNKRRPVVGSIGFKENRGKFVAPMLVPEAVESAMAAMVRLCACYSPKDSQPNNCITLTAVGTGGRFVTNLHALDGLKKTLKTDSASCEKPFFFIPSEKGIQRIEIPETLRIGKRPKDLTDKKNHTWDLAQIRIPELKDVKPLNLSPEDGPTVNTVAYHIGFPRNFGLRPLQACVSFGKVKEIKSLYFESDFLGVIGTSGGPVLDEQGHITGIFWGKEPTPREDPLLGFASPKFKEAQNNNTGFKDRQYPETSYSIPVTVLRDFLKDSLP